jgi:hypothetical protein
VRDKFQQLYRLIREALTWMAIRGACRFSVINLKVCVRMEENVKLKPLAL